MRYILFSMFVAALSFLPTQAPAQDADTIADARCVIVGTLLAQKPDPTQRTAGSMVSMYYIGRLDGRAPKLDLEALIIKEAATMTNSDIASEAKRCGAALTTRGRAITQMGKDIVERAQKTSGEQAK